MSTSGRRQALIIIPSAKDLPLAEPKNTPSVSTGFFLVELAAILKEFESDYDFILATPDGQAPQLDVNGMGLSFHAAEQMSSQSVKHTLQQRKDSFDADTFRARYHSLAARREDELQLLERHLGRVAVSEALPNTEREVVAFRPELVRRLDALQPTNYASVEELVRRHRDPADEFDFAALDFIHAPGGHAPMVSFLEDPWLGEALHLARENKVLISLICHAPVAMTSTNQRIDANGNPHRIDDNPFHAATITTVPKRGEKLVERFGYVAVPGERTKLTYYVDEAIEAAGFKVKTSLNPASPRLVHEPAVGLLTGNGPSAVDQQTRKIREILSGAQLMADA